MELGLIEVREEPHLVWTTKSPSTWPKKVREPYQAAKHAKARKGLQAKPTARHKDRTKYDRKRVKVAVEMPSGKRHVDCRSVLLDPKED
jgi:hypothetical protein